MVSFAEKEVRQDAGEMLLRIEARIGELLPKPEDAMKGMVETSAGRTRYRRPDGGRGRIAETDVGVSSQRASRASAIHSHPEAVKRVIKEALAVEMLPEFEKEARERKGLRGSAENLPVDSHGYAAASVQAAKAVGTSGRSVEQAKRVKQEAPAAFEEVVKGTKSVDAADKELTVKRLAKDKIPENERIHGLLGEEEFAEWASWAQIRIKVKQRHALHELSSDARREISKLITGIRSDIAEITGGE